MNRLRRNEPGMHFLKDVWCAERLGDWLVDTTLAAVEAIRADERAAGATELSDIQDQLLVHGGRMMTIHHDILLERAVELAEGLTQGSMAQRLVGGRSGVRPPGLTRSPGSTPSASVSID